MGVQQPLNDKRQNALSSAVDRTQKEATQKYYVKKSGCMGAVTVTRGSWDGPEELKVTPACCCFAGKVQGAYEGKYAANHVSSIVSRDGHFQFGAATSRPLRHTTLAMTPTTGSCCLTRGKYMLSHGTLLEASAFNAVTNEQTLSIREEASVVVGDKGCCPPRPDRRCCVFGGTTGTALVWGPQGTFNEQIMGTMTSGSECCGATGGVFDVPAELAPEDLLQWTLLWMNTGLPVTRAWANRQSLKKVETMQ